MTDAFEEVEESLRHEKAAKAWNKAWPLLLGAAVAVVAVVGGLEYMRWQKDQAIAKTGAVYAKGSTAMGQSDLAAAKVAFTEVGAGKSGFSVLANHTLAGLESELTNDPAAVAGYLTAAADADIGILSDIAILKLAYVRADAVDLTELTRTVDPLVKKGGTLGALSRELLAAKKLAAGDVDAARREYQALALDLDAPQNMKQRVQQTLMSLPKEAAPPAPAATESTPPAGQTQQ